MEADHLLRNVADMQVVKTPAGEEFVFVPRQHYEALLEALAEAEEDLADIAAYDEAMAELAAGELPPFPPEVNRLIGQRHRRIAALRLWRGHSVTELATKAGVSEADIVAFEAGERIQSVEQADRLAVALDVHHGWLRP